MLKDLNAYINKKKGKGQVCAPQQQHQPNATVFQADQVPPSPPKDDAAYAIAVDECLSSDDQEHEMDKVHF
jgi:hypothetical protein